jgi:hypothetical protein
MNDTAVSVPLGWGADDLTAFLQTAQQNTYATFHRKKVWYDALKTLDDCYLKINNNLLNPIDQIAPLFLLRAHSAYRATCGLAMAGQVVEGFALNRLCLEYSGYALFIHDKPAHRSVWFDKSKGAPQIKAFRQAFTQTNVRAAIEAHDAKLAKVYDDLYQRAIDAGAHPNELAVSGSMQIVDEPEADRVHIKQLYLQADGVALDYGLKSTVQIGICSLHLFQWIFKERFELLGIRETLTNLRNTRGL